MVEDNEIKSLRLLLCSRTLLIMEIGANILGIDMLEEM
jgi:arginyl-tRNA synthetase